MVYLHRKAQLLLFVAMWMVFAPGLFELQQLYADGPQGMEVEEVRVPPVNLNDIVTAAEAIKEFNQALFTAEEPTDEDVELSIAAQWANILAESMANEGEESFLRDIRNFYEEVSRLHELNDRYSGYLGTILTWGNYFSSGRESLSGSQIEVNIAVDSFRKLVQLGETKTQIGATIMNNLRSARALCLQKLSNRMPGTMNFLTRGSNSMGGVVSNTSAVLDRVLPFITFALALHSTANNENVQARVFNRDAVESGVDLIMASAAIIVLFLVPPAKIILATVALVKFAVTTAINIIASNYRRKMEAYKASYDFLMQADPEFPVYVMAFHASSELTTEDASAEDIQRIVLNNYYHQNQDRLTTFAAGADNREAVRQYSQLWEQKALFLSWQNVESNDDDGLFTIIGHGVQNVGRSIQRLRPTVRSTVSELLEDNHPLMANPDFVLISLLENYVRHVSANSDVNQYLLNRVKRNPFLFMYLIEIPQNEYYIDDHRAFKESLALDSLNISWMEISGLKAMLEEIQSHLDQESSAHLANINEQKQALSAVKNTIDCAINLSNALREDSSAELDRSAKRDLDTLLNVLNFFTENDVRGSVRNQFRSMLSWNDFTYEELFQHQEFKVAFEALITSSPLAVSSYLASLQKAITTADMNQMLIEKMETFIEQAESNLSEYQSYITRPEIKVFSEEGRYLGIREGGGFLGFISDIQPVERRYSDTIRLVRNAVRRLKSTNEMFLFEIGVDGRGYGMGASFELSDANELQAKLRELLEIHSNLPYLESEIELNSTFAEELYLTREFELKRFEASVQ